MQRHIVLDGAVNCRDLGGYRNQAGRALRWGHLLRSDSLAQLSEADHARLSALGLRSVFDLRHPEERGLQPSRSPPGAALQVHALGFYPPGAAQMMQQVRERSLAPEQAFQAMVALYQHMPQRHAADFARLLALLLQAPALPALIHCTSGKDRTGWAVACVLLALEVPRTTILEDYLLTNTHRRDLSFMLGHDTDPQVLEVVKAADARFLQAAFDAIDQRWGGSLGYLRQALGLSEQDQAQLQALLLQDA